MISSLAISRDVAQSGSARDWGSRGRRFESGRPDHTFYINVAFSHQKMFCGSGSVTTRIE